MHHYIFGITIFVINIAIFRHIVLIVVGIKNGGFAVPVLVYCDDSLLLYLDIYHQLEKRG